VVEIDVAVVDAGLVTRPPGEVGTVRQGSRVRIREGNRDARTLQIRDDAAPAYVYDGLHPETPLGRALMGRHVGDEVEVVLHEALPVRRVTVESIE
jgi:transcription elongation GreA/GreB family factor